MSRKSSVLSALEKKKEVLTKIGVSKIGLFGSVVREEASPDSDIDILVDFAPSARKFRKFNQLCDVFGDDYDLVTMAGSLKL